MTQLASYVFKPKHGYQVARKIIQRFCDDFLHYEHEGFYLHWRVAEEVNSHHPRSLRPLPAGYAEFSIEVESPNMDCWSETCYEDRGLTGQELTDDFFALLGDDFWFANEEGKPDYHFYERELAEVVAALSAENTRLVSFGTTRTAWVMDIDTQGKYRSNTIDLLDYALTVPTVKKTPQGEQLKLAF